MMTSFNLYIIYFEFCRVSGIDRPIIYQYQVILPSDLTCNKCVLQWKYNTGEIHFKERVQNCFNHTLISSYLYIPILLSSKLWLNK